MPPIRSYNVSQSFADLGVPARLVEALAADGITEPFPVQAITLPDALAGKDLCGRAPTGSGKTLGFGIPMMVRIGQAAPHRPTGLVLVPTRELAEQVQKVFVTLGRAQWRFVQAIYGGASFGPQIHSLRKGASVVVATPGRLLDIIEKGYCDLSAVEVCVIDEADRMADLGFMPDLRKILDMTPATRQTMLWSATLDGDVQEIIQDYMKDPVRHDLMDDVEQAPVDHRFVVTRPSERIDAAVALIEEHGPTVVFVKTRYGVDDVSEDLNRAGVKAGALHGARSQAVRQRTLDDFKRGKIQALVATDVAARGIHVDNVSLVLHYDLPDNDKDYTHRSGRTGRAGNAGVVIAFVPPSRQRIAQRMSDNVEAEVTWEQGEKPIERVPAGERETGNRDRGERDRGGYQGRGDRNADRGAYSDRTSRGGYVDRAAASDRGYGGDRDRSDRGERTERTERPAYGGERPAYGAARTERPAYGADRDRSDRGERSERNDRPVYGAARAERPAYGADRGERGGYQGRNDRTGGSGSGGDRPAYGAARGGYQGRGGSGERGGYQGRNDRTDAAPPPRDRNDWSPRPRRDDSPAARAERPAYGASRGGYQGRNERTDGAPASRDRNDFTPRPRRDDDRGNDRGRFNRDDRPRFSAERGDSRPGASRPTGDRPGFARDGQRPPYGRDGSGDRPWRNRDDAAGADRPRYSSDRGDRSGAPQGDARPSRPGYGAGKPGGFGGNSGGGYRGAGGAGGAGGGYKGGGAGRSTGGFKPGGARTGGFKPGGFKRGPATADKRRPQGD